MRFQAIREQLQRRLAPLDGAWWSATTLVMLTACVTAAGLALRAHYLLPFLQAAVAWPFFVASCAQGQVARAAARVLMFALAAGIIVTYAVAVGAKDAYDQTIMNGLKYRDEMFAFVRSGGVVGEEAHFSQFFPMHALHLGIFCALCTVSGGFLGLVMGATLLDYMSFYVGSLAAEAAQHGSVWKTLLCAWAPYSIVRVIAYALLGSGITTWTLGPRDARVRAKGAILVGIALAIVDVAAKAFLAKGYGSTLLVTTGLK